MRWTSTAMPGTPPSVNELPLDTRNHRYRRARDRWQAEFALVMHEHGNVLPRRLERVTAYAMLTFNARRRRDEGNYRAPLEKWLGDVLQHTGRLPDDTPDRYRFKAVTFVAGAVDSTVIVLNYDTAARAA